jgi:hypothetical protein
MSAGTSYDDPIYKSYIFIYYFQNISYLYILVINIISILLINFSIISNIILITYIVGNLLIYHDDIYKNHHELLDIKLI